MASQPNHRRYHLPPITLLQLIVELGLLVVIPLIETQHLQNWSPDLRIPGDEFSYLVNSGAIASAVFQKTDAIPLWNPFIGSGEPLLESPFSFVLNPFMSWPILWSGPVVGSKIAVIIHIMLMALGGWTLGRVLRLGSPGRARLGRLLAGCGCT